MQHTDENKRIVMEILEKIKEAKKKDNWNQINTELTEKRLDWYEKNKNNLNLQGTDVKKAYTLLLMKIGISPEEAPVVYEDENKIVWRSYNWCPVLEACKIGGFDTREVCKKGWEQSVQALIKKINPKLRFFRTYETLRPHGGYCEEIIELFE